MTYNVNINSSKPLIIVAGPTSSGKTGLGIELAKKFNGVILSADSRMVYRKLDIGTGKPTWEYRTLGQSPWLTPVRIEPCGPVYLVEGVEHHLLDIVEPQSDFALTDWLSVAKNVLQSIRKDQLPILVGGTNLYIKSLLEGYEPPPTDPSLRIKIEQLSTAEIIDELAKVDPITARREQANRRRLVRALEVARLIGKPMSVSNNQSIIDALVLAIDWPREELYRRIDQRIDERFGSGVIDEVKSLIKNGVSVDWLKRLGLEYRLVTEWLDNNYVGGEISNIKDYKELIEKVRGAHHAYARRQITYLRHQLPVKWVKNEKDAEVLVNEFLASLRACPAKAGRSEAIHPEIAASRLRRDSR